MIEEICGTAAFDIRINGSFVLDEAYKISSCCFVVYNLDR